MLHRQAHIKKIKIKKNNFKSNSDSLCVPTPPPQKKKRSKAKLQVCQASPWGSVGAASAHAACVTPQGTAPKLCPGCYSAAALTLQPM